MNKLASKYEINLDEILEENININKNPKNLVKLVIAKSYQNTFLKNLLLRVY